VLSSHNANLNRKDSSSGATILHLYIKNGDKWASEFLLDSGARLDLLDNNNETVLHYLGRKNALGNQAKDAVFLESSKLLYKI